MTRINILPAKVRRNYLSFIVALGRLTREIDILLHTAALDLISDGFGCV